MLNAGTGEFAPLSYDLIQNSPESNVALGKLITGEIKILKIFQCNSRLFENMQEEIMSLVKRDHGQILTTGHVTFDYISKWDPTWRLKPGTVYQYSLYNSKNDFCFFDEDHHWCPGGKFNSTLKYVPKFFATNFRDSELQNFRVNAIAGGGDLGQHRERIVAIPKREQHYKLRFHLPIITNPGVRFLMDGCPFKMEEKWIYLFNQGCMHSVTNDEDALRVHLVWDCYLNDYIAQKMITPALHAQTTG